MNDRQLGRFEISVNLIRKKPDTVASMFALLKLIPVEAKPIIASETIQYVAISDRFDEVVLCSSPIPEYQLGIQSDESGGVMDVTVNKIPKTCEDES